MWVDGDGIADEVFRDGFESREPNRPPRLALIANQTAATATLFTLTANAVDPDLPNDLLRWRLDQAPAGMSIASATGGLQWTPAPAQIGAHPVTVRVTDRDGAFDTASFSVSVNAFDPGNRPPTLAAIGNASLREGQSLALIATADDPDLPSDALRWTLTEAPSGVSLGRDDGSLLWTPTGTQLGAYRFTVRVTDSSGAFDEEQFVVEVASRGNPPVLGPLADQVATLGEAWSLTATADDADLPEDGLTFGLLTGPAGLAIDGATGAMSWTPDASDVGVHDVTVRVEDQDGLDDFGSFTVEVRGINRAPVARNDRYAVRIGETLDVPGPGVLENDRDDDGDVLRVLIETLAQNGDLDLDPDGAFRYTPTLPAVTGTRTGAGVNLARLSPNTVSFSSQENPRARPNDTALRAFDGTPLTSWRTALDDPDPWLELTFAEDVTVGELRYSGNRDWDGSENGAPVVGTDFLTGVLRLLDAGGTELWTSGVIDLTPPLLDLPIDTGTVAGVRRVRFEGVSWNGRSPGIGELAVIGDGPITPLNPVVEWSFDGTQELFAGLPAASVHTTPIVIDFDGDGEREIIFAAGTSNHGGFIGGNGHVVILDGTTGAEEYVQGPDPGVNDMVSMAAGDIDGDGRPELVAVQASAFSDFGLRAFLVAYEHDMSVKWVSDELEWATWGAISLADLDADGRPEILFGRSVLDADGRLLWRHDRAAGQSVMFAVDLDLDGDLEVIDGGLALEHDGTELWFDFAGSSAEGRAAVGNFDDDPYPEIVVVHSDLRLFEHDGTLIWAVPTAFRGGAPTVADFDGDGRPEIGVLDGFEYTVYEGDGQPIWSFPIYDGSAQTGSAVFDFDGDGSAEVVMRDEYDLLILRGTDGQLLWRMPYTSATWNENPVIADVDDDGNAEIVVGASFGIGFGQQRMGLRVIGGADGDWIRTRGIWNQHAYSISNVAEDGTLPTPQRPNWLLPGMNNFRQQGFMPDDEGRADRFTYRADDGQARSEPATVYIELLPDNAAPEIISEPDRSATLGIGYLYAVAARDADFDPLVFTLQQGPAGMTIEADTGLLRWLPPALGTYPVAVRVEDDEGFFALQSFELNVAEAQEVPDVVDELLSEAEALLTADGFAVGRTREETHPTIAAGRVIAQAPPAGSVAEFGAPVALVLSSGPGPDDLDDDGDGFTENEGDCDDAAPNVFPGATDAPGDGVDQDCDGFDATAPLERLEVRVSEATLLAGETLELDAWGYHADGSATRVDAIASWSSDGPAADVDGFGTVLAIQAGTALITATAGGQSASATVTVRAFDAADDTPPTLAITSPDDGAAVFAPIDVRGTAVDDGLVRYELALAPAGSDDFAPIATGNAPVSDGVLGTLDPTLLLNGLYTLRLTVQDAGNNTRFEQIDLLVDGGMKIGHFALSYEDLNVPVAGFPLTLSRHYDSRDKAQGAFGVGWRLGLQTMQIHCSEALSEGWFVARAGFTFGLLPTRAHACSVQQPGQRAEVFDLVVGPSTSPVVPYTLVTGHFVPRPGTTGTLEVPGGIFLAVTDPQPGAVRLFNDGNLSAFEPTAFVYTSGTGERAVFEDRVLRSIEDRNGNRLTITDDEIAHSSGLGIDLERDAQGRITRITDPAGRIQTYAYDAEGNLVRHVDPVGVVSEFRYGPNHLLVDYDTPGRRPARTEYDADGRIQAVIDALGERIEVTHDVAGRSGVRRDRNGQVTAYEYDDQGNITRLVDERGEAWNFTFDDQGRKTSSTNPLGETTTFAYDPLDKLVMLTDPAGGVWRWERDATGRVTREIDPTGVTTTHDYDARGNRIRTTDARGNTYRYAYDSAGNLLSEIDPAGRATGYAYNAFGQMTEIRAPSGAVQQFVLDEVGQRSRVRYTVTTEEGDETVDLDIERDARNLPQTMTFPIDSAPLSMSYDLSGALAGTVDGEGNVQSLTRDLLGRVTRSEASGGAVLSMVYDAEGRDVAVTLPDGGTVETDRDARGDALSTRFPDTDPWLREYDAAGRVERSTRPGLGEERTVYDTAGRVVRVELPDAATFSLAYDDAGRVTAQTDPLGGTIQRRYDARGKLVETEFPDGRVVEKTWTADGQVASYTDPLGATMAYEWRDTGVSRVVDPLGGVSRYERGVNGLLTAYISPEGRTYRLGYDAGGRQTRFTRPGGATARCEMDALARPAICVDFLGRETRWDYDDAAAAIAITRPEGPERRRYDGSGKLLSVETPAGDYLRSYDGAQRLVSWSSPRGPAVQLFYAGSPFPERLETDSGIAREYGYDSRGMRVAVSDTMGAFAFRYDAGSRPTGVDFPGGAAIDQSLDAVGRVTRLRYEGPTGAGLAAFDYTYDAQGRLASESWDGVSASYAYDAMGQLLGAQRSGAAGSWTLALEYDGDGNLVRRVEDGAERRLQYDIDGHLVTDGPFQLVWNGNGRLEERIGPDGRERFGWDSQGRLVAYERTGSDPTTVEYGYSPDGLLELRRQDGVTELFTWDREGPLATLIEIAETTGQRYRRYLYHGLQAVAEQDESGAVVHHVRDRLGSLRLRVSADGTVLERFDYGPFGERLEGSASPVGYTGGYTDVATGFVFLRSRWYAPDHARFLSRDSAPILDDDPRSANRYSYAFNDPLNRIDLTGQAPTLAQVLTGIAVGNALAMATIAYLTDPDRAFSNWLGLRQVWNFWLQRVDGRFASRPIGQLSVALVSFPSISVNAGIASVGSGLEFVRWNSGYRSIYATFGSALGGTIGKKPGGSNLTAASGGALSFGSKIADTPTPEDYQGAFVSAGLSLAIGMASVGFEGLNLKGGGQIFWSPIFTYNDFEGNARHSHGRRAGANVGKGEVGLSARLSFDWYFMVSNYRSSSVD